MRRIYEKENKKETRKEKKKETRASRLYDIEISVARDALNASPIY